MKKKLGPPENNSGNLITLPVNLPLMKSRLLFFLATAIILSLIYSCQKQEYFKSEKGIKSELQGTWDLIPIPRYITSGPDSGSERHENWVFTSDIVTITTNTESGTSDYSVHTSWSKAEVELKGVTAPLNGGIYNGKWQIVRLDGSIMAIANDHDGSTGLTQLEFQKRN